MTMVRLARRAITTGVAASTILWSVFATSLMSPLNTASAQAACVSGSLIKGSLPAVYYCGADGKRYVFPNEKTYFTWYSNFDSVQTISNTALSSLVIGGNVTSRPGVKMIKLESDPKVYAVSHDGVLHWVTTQEIATCLYGNRWNHDSVFDLSVAFYSNYTVGSQINNCSDYDRLAQMNSSQTINQDKGLSPAADTTRPTVISTDPQNGAVNVAVGKTISATFSEAMNPSTIHPTTFTLTGPGTNPVAGSVNLSNNTAFFDPTANLEINTTYTATIKTSAYDLAGNSLAANYSWTFTTGPTPAPDTTAPTVISTDPSSGATSIAPNKTVVAIFSEPMNAASLNATTFTLTGPGSTSVSGTVSYTSNTASFNPTNDLLADTTFTATITTGAKDTSGNSLANIYAWVFTTGSIPDTTAPVVTSTIPANGGTNIALNTTVTATFNEVMDPASINGSTMTLTGPGATPIAGTVSYTGATAYFDPTANLANNTTYTATITTGARDNAGNNLASNFVWTFTTLP